MRVYWRSAGYVRRNDQGSDEDRNLDLLQRRHVDRGYPEFVDVHSDARLDFGLLQFERGRRMAVLVCDGFELGVRVHCISRRLVGWLLLLLPLRLKVINLHYFREA